jgi:hypothetical protein
VQSARVLVGRGRRSLHRPHGGFLVGGLRQCRKATDFRFQRLAPVYQPGRLRSASGMG